MFEDLILGFKLSFINENELKQIWKFLTYYIRDFIIVVIFSILTYLRSKNIVQSSIYNVINNYQNFMRVNFCLSIFNLYLIENHESARVFLEFYEEFSIFKQEFKDLSNVGYFELRSNAYTIFSYYFESDIHPSLDLSPSTSRKTTLKRLNTYSKKNSMPERNLEQDSELVSDKELSLEQHNYITFPEKVTKDINIIANKYFKQNSERSDEIIEMFNMFNDSFAFVDSKLESLYNEMVNDEFEKKKFDNVVLFCDFFERIRGSFQRFPTMPL